MKRIATLAVALAFAFAPALPLAPLSASAQDAAKASKAPAVKAGKDEKVCNYRFESGPAKGERRSWVCKKEQPCCAWDAISYVKCGSTITGCL